jgi:hypothetical protein
MGTLNVLQKNDLVAAFQLVQANTDQGSQLAYLLDLLLRTKAEQEAEFQRWVALTRVRQQERLDGLELVKARERDDLTRSLATMDALGAAIAVVDDPKTVPAPA